MASTFVDNYTLVDTINTQLPSATQYNSNEGDATLTTDSYAPTSDSVHTIPTALRSLATGALTDDGYSQKSLYELLLMINVNWDNAMKQLDDSSLGTSDYETSFAIGPLDGAYSVDSATSFGASTTALRLGLGQGVDATSSTGAMVNIHPEGISTHDLAVWCEAMNSTMVACFAQCDTDSVLDTTTYNTLAVGFTASTGNFDAIGASVAFTVLHPDTDKYGPHPGSYITTTGIKQGALISYLNSIVTNLNTFWTALDADI